MLAALPEICNEFTTRLRCRTVRRADAINGSSSMLEVIGIFGMIIGIGNVLDSTFFRSVTKQRYTKWLFQPKVRFISDIGIWTIALFDLCLSNNRTKISFWRSATISIILISIFSIVVTSYSGQGIRAIFAAADYKNFIGICVIFIANVLGDYASLWKTRILMQKIVGKNGAILVATLVCDFLLSFLIWSGIVTAIFWTIANSFSVPEWAGWRPIVWHMCHQANSILVVLASSPQELAQNCDFILLMPRSKENPPNFEHVFNAASLLTTYAASFWMLMFISVQYLGRSAQDSFIGFFRRFGRLADFNKFPFTFTGVYFGVMYLISNAIYKLIAALI